MLNCYLSVHALLINVIIVNVDVVLVLVAVAVVVVDFLFITANLINQFQSGMEKAEKRK